MALDHALAACHVESEATLRLYSWTRPTVSFGRNEPSRRRYSVSEGKRLGIDYVRRPTGGRAVLHDSELTYSVVAPLRAFGGVREAYRRINGALANALRSMGAAVTLAEGNSVSGVDAGPCFQAPADGEVVLADRKLVGSAQARLGGALLQHGSIILAGDQTRLDALRLDGPVPARPGREMIDGERSAGVAMMPATLEEALGPIEGTVVAEFVVREMSASFGGVWGEGRYSERELTTARRLEADQYRTCEWTWRR
jgi:lipoate-protein ligase A